MSSQRSAAQGGEPAAPDRTKNAFGTFGGVFTPSILTILGLILFMRAAFVVGHAGIGLALAILCVSKAITLLTSLSIAAISTNMQVRGGGAYYLISRVLGPEFGGAIGIALYLALALSVPFYFLGFAEALVQTFPAAAPHFQKITLGALAVFFAIAYVGASWAIRVQYVILTVLGLAIAAFLAGAALRFTGAQAGANLGAIDADGLARAGGAAKLAFWTLFALYFPAVTGIDAGLNMSGDLEDPARSIPKGTLVAVLVGFGVYAAQIVLVGGAFSREQLILEPFAVLKDHALLGVGFIVVAGAFAATLSSALGSLLGAPRVLQAVARDRILGVLQPFAKGSAVGDEPRRASVLTLIASAAVLLWAGNGSGGGALNAIAAIITMFFLYSYGLINLAAFVEAFGQNPSFRPRFRLFHWATGLLGAVGCVVVAAAIEWTAAVVALVVIAGLIAYVKAQQLESVFGDARRGFVFQRVRQNLLRLAEMEEDAKNWRPTILLLSGNPSSRETLVTYAVWLEAGCGIVLLGNVLVGEVGARTAHRRMAVRKLEDFCRENEVQAFPAVVLADDLDQGISTLLQTAGMGPVQPNLVMFGWSDDRSRIAQACRHLRIAERLGKSLVLLVDRGLPRPGPGKRVDVWWRGQANGGLMLLLTHLLLSNWEWGRAEVRVLRQVRDEAGREPAEAALRTLLEASRLNARVQAIVADGAFSEVLRQHSRSATLVVLGLQVPAPDEAEAWHERLGAMLEGLPTTLLVSSAGLESLE